MLAAREGAAHVNRREGLPLLLSPQTTPVTDTREHPLYQLVGFIAAVQVVFQS